jgi:hypothetical protein
LYGKANTAAAQHDPTLMGRKNNKQNSGHGGGVVGASTSQQRRLAAQEATDRHSRAAGLGGSGVPAQGLVGRPPYLAL